MSAEPVRVDRRHLRRLETIEQIVDVAVEVMAEFGVGGLSLAEVARRMGMRSPSLYGYFDSKHAVYDAVFARGWRSILATMAPVSAGVHEADDLPAYLLVYGRRFVGWMLEHPVQAQLMCWRPVPGYEPSPAAYAPAVEMLALARTVFATLRERALFRADTDVDRLLRTWTVLTSGVMTQQLANAPGGSLDDGAFTATLPDLVSMYLALYGTTPTTRGSHE
jgi:AcrR family transcriptional regulator